MQIKVTTDYAIRMVFYAAVKNEVVNSTELSEKLGIPQSIVLKLAKPLAQHGIVDVTTGVKGGIRLVMPPDEITLLEILNIFEPTTKINRCLEEDRYCSRFATETCPVRRAYVNMQQQIEEKFNSITIASLI